SDLMLWDSSNLLKRKNRTNFIFLMFTSSLFSYMLLMISLQNLVFTFFYSLDASWILLIDMACFDGFLIGVEVLSDCFGWKALLPPPRNIYTFVNHSRETERLPWVQFFKFLVILRQRELSATMEEHKLFLARALIPLHKPKSYIVINMPSKKTRASLILAWHHE
ncbi:hypothetical protein ACJX0J_023437, partial [Zea mays]